jgi:hypothetical protein
MLRVESAALLGIAEHAEIPCRQIGNEWRASRDALLAWLDREPTVADRADLRHISAPRQSRRSSSLA